MRGPVADFVQCKRARQRVALRFFVERLAGGIAEREVAEQEARHPDVFDDVARAPHYDRWYSIRLEVARHETDGLMANGTIRDEQRDVGLQLAARGQHGRCVAFLRCALAAIGRHADHVVWPAIRSRRARLHSGEPSPAATCSDRPRWCGFDRRRCARSADPAAGRSVLDTSNRTSHRHCKRRPGPCSPRRRIEARGRGDQNEARARDARRAHKRNRWERRPLIRRVAERGIVRTRSLHVRDRFAGVLTNRRGHPRP